MNGKVFIVNDDLGTTALVEARLPPRGFEVKSVYDGERALQAFLERKPDIILLDVMMPYISGLGDTGSEMVYHVINTPICGQINNSLTAY